MIPESSDALDAFASASYGHRNAACEDAQVIGQVFAILCFHQQMQVISDVGRAIDSNAEALGINVDHGRDLCAVLAVEHGPIAFSAGRFENKMNRRSCGEGAVGLALSFR